MSTKSQLLKEAKMLETKLANVNKKIARAEKLRMQMLAGVITESQYKSRLNEEEDNGEFKFEPTGERGFDEFVNKIATNIFTAGVNDPTMAQVDGWDTLFEYWEDFGDLSMHTQSDIIELAQESGVSESDIDYILGLPQVTSLERG